MKENREQRGHNDRDAEPLAPARAPVVIKAICGVRVDDYNAIALKVMEHTHITEEAPSLYINIEDGGVGSGASFFFDDVHEARTFAKRMLAQLDGYLPA